MKKNFLRRLLGPIARGARHFLSSFVGDDAYSNWLVSLFGGRESSSGIRVTPESAMHVAAVFACVRVLAETFAVVPMCVKERMPDGSRRIAYEHPLNAILLGQPNGWQTFFEWKEMMQGHVSLRGNAYSQIVAGINGAVTQLIPLHPGRVVPKRLVNGRLIYEVTMPDGGTRTLVQDEVFHLRGLSSDGIVGLSPVEHARDTIGLTKSAEDHGAYFFRNYATPSGILTTDSTLNKQAEEANKRSWMEGQGGHNKHSIAVMQGGLKWQNVGLTNIESQFLETRQFQLPEICRIFRVPPHMIAELSRATFANIEQQSIEFVRYTMMPWGDRWAAAMARDLISDPSRYYIDYDWSYLLKGDAAARAAYLQILVNSGIMSINEARAFEGLDPIPNGDVHFVQGAMVTIERAIAGPPQPPPLKLAAAAEPAGAVRPDESGQEQRAAGQLAIADESKTVLLLSDARAAAEREAAELRLRLDESAAAAVEIAAGRLRSCIAWEADGVRRAARREGFLAEIEGFYVGQLPRLVENLRLPLGMLRSLGCDAPGCDEFCELHVELSKSQLLELAGRHAPETLPAAVEQLVSTWPARVDAFREQLLLLSSCPSRPSV